MKIEEIGETCRDCMEPADPECIEHAPPGYEGDLHFCRSCKDKANELVELFMSKIEDGTLTIEEANALLIEAEAEDQRMKN